MLGWLWTIYYQDNYKTIFWLKSVKEYVSSLLPVKYLKSYDGQEKLKRKNKNPIKEIRQNLVRDDVFNRLEQKIKEVERKEIERKLKDNKEQLEIIELIKQIQKKDKIAKIYREDIDSTLKDLSQQKLRNSILTTELKNLRKEK